MEARARNQVGRPEVFTAERKKMFLEALSASENNTVACFAGGIATATLHKHLRHDPQFRERYEEIKRRIADDMLQEVESLSLRIREAEKAAGILELRQRLDTLKKLAARTARTA